MKKGLSTLALSLLLATGFSQRSTDFYPVKYGFPVKSEKLTKAVSWNDIVSDYPSRLKLHCLSVEISATCQGKALSITATGDELSAEQKALLSAVDLGTDVVIDFNYSYSKRTYVVTVVPEVEAEYPGGYQQMAQYLRENVINQIAGSTGVLKMPELTLTFSVDEQGQVVEPKLSRPSADEASDKLLSEVLHKMPKWIPAENSKGVKVKQEFKLSTPFFLGKGC